MARRPMAVARMEKARLTEYVKAQPEGAEILFSSVEIATGVVMDPVGRQRLRTVLEELGIERTSLYGKGIVLADINTYPRIIEDKFHQVGIKINSTRRTIQNVKDRFFHRTDADGQRALLYQETLIDAIETHVENAKAPPRTRPRGGHAPSSVPLPRR